MTLQLNEPKPAFGVSQVQVLNGYVYLVMNNVGTCDAHNVKIRCELELIEGRVAGETVFPLQRWRPAETRKFAVRFNTGTWYRYFDTSPLKIIVTSDEATKQIRLE